MEIKNYHQDAQVQGVTSNSFGFEMNAKMYDILISKMYTNKQGAVIRELSANAWDAHVEAGNSDKPFDLHLPSWLDKTFHIRDYGTGIPHDKFEHIYTNVGSSTKEHTNDLIGGFGLGSKTPFTMTDTFMVENWCSGIKTTWVCFKDKGEPQVSKVGEEPSDEPSGLKVSFSFDEGDVLEFTKQIVRQLRFFPVKPNVTGGEGDIEFPNMPEGWDTQDYFYTTEVGKYSRPTSYLVMGNVAYTLDPNELDSGNRMYALFQKGIILKADIGAVDIPPSRESLEMTDRTKSYIMKRLEVIIRDYNKDIQTQLDKCANEWEVRKVLFEVNYSLLATPHDLTWNNNPLDVSTFRSRYVHRVAGYNAKGIVRSYSNVYRSTGLDMRKAIDGKLKYYVNDIGMGYSKLINEKYTSVDTLDVVILHIDKVTKNNRESLVKKARAEIKEVIGEEPKLLSSLFGFPSKTTASGTRKVAGQAYKVPKNLCRFTSIKSQVEELDELPEDGYYMELSSWSICSDVPDVRTLLDEGLTHYTDKPLYFIRSKSIPKLAKGMKQLNLKECLKFKDKIKEEAHKELTRRKISSITHNITPLYFSFLKEVGNKRMKTYARYCLMANKRIQNETKLRGGSALYIHQTLSDDKKPLVAHVPKKLEQLSKEYDPIQDTLRAVCNSWSKERNEERLQALVNLIK